ncbi:hypothetical protein QTP88_023859 [Uroleucon formosanum]
MIAIDYDQQTAKKSRRGLGSAVNRITNVIYGMCSRINTDFIVDNIIELGKNKLKNLNLIHDRTRISEVETTETNRTLKSLKIHQQQIEENLKHLQQQIENNTQNINLMSFKTKLLEQAFLFEVILNKFAYDTQNLMAIVNTALNGKIYTSALTSQTLMSELREIKMNLPMGSILPIEITTESLTEFLRISEITIFTQKNYLIFVIEIPLLSNEKYTVYHPIPLPIPHTDRTIVLIDTEVEYLALSSDNEKFFTLSTEQWEKCKSLGLDKLCKQDSLIHHRLGSDSCEVSLLTDPQPFPKTCNLKFISLNANIWHKLTKTNTWLYYTQHSTLGTISCSNSLEKFPIEINNVGRITISKSCKINIDNSMFIAESKSNRNVKLDIISHNAKKITQFEITENLKGLVPQNLTNTKFIKNLNILASKAVELMLPAAKEIVRCVLGDTATKEIEKVSLSNDTVKRRIDDMSSNIKNKLLLYLNDCNFFILQIDESTDIANMAQLLVFIRFDRNDEIIEEFLFCKSLQTHTTSEIIFTTINEYLIEIDLPWSKCVGFCSEGAKAMTGRLTGVATRIKKVAPLSVQAQWLKFARENGINETLLKPSVSLFCLTHFAASCFDRFTHTTNLKSNAIPTIKIKRVKCAKILYPEIKIPIPVDEPLCIQSNSSTPACRNSTDQPVFKEIKGPSEFSSPTVVQESSKVKIDEMCEPVVNDSPNRLRLKRTVSTLIDLSKTLELILYGMDRVYKALDEMVKIGEKVKILQLY